MLDSIPVFAVLKAKLGYDSERQKLISQNVANADTPGYAPKDLSKFSFGGALQAAAGGVAPVRTHAMHLAGRAAQAGGWKAAAAPDSEARLDGGQVVLEDQMMKMTEARTDYEAALTLYSQSLNLLRTAAKAPGK
ncbi:MAG: flagellar basal body rod protein FlgB [Caulobacteraceae bacterium]|nr:flagellar basal body rod protein FlgB [Caulobacter sp.]